MKKIVRLTEFDLNKIVKRTINESINQVAEDFRGTCKRVSYSLEDLDSATKKGDGRKIEEAKDLVKHQVRMLENIIEELKRKLR